MFFSSNYKALSVLVLVILFFGLAAFFNLSSPWLPAALSSSSSPDAIAFRVMPNPDHLSPSRWYQENIKVKGSPQGLTVDGYEAVRDGRTVYVNAANISGNNFYTNIYIISYNQQAEDPTVDIFGQILSHWKFNTNITDANPAGAHCSKTVARACLYSSDCPSGEYCLSQKAKTIRDTKRLADLADIKFALANYQAGHNGNYPGLLAGSYLTGKTISTWPSWQATFGAALGLTMPLDPVNKLGDCSSPLGYNPITCWNQTEKKFAGVINADGSLTSPDNSHAYIYTTNAGKSFNLCAIMESGLITKSDGSCLGNVLTNNPPVITGVNLTGQPNKKFTGYISVSDPDGDNLSYKIELETPNSSQGWKDQAWTWETGLENFKLTKSKVAGQIIVSAAKAGKASQPGMYKVKFTVDDHQGHVVSQIFELRINSLAMGLSSGVASEVEIGENKTYSLTGTDSSGDPFTSLQIKDFTLDGSAVDMATHGFSLNGMTLAENYTEQQKTGTYRINVYATDPSTGARKDSFVQINLVNHPPVINGLTATYANNTQQTYSAGAPFAIDNGENATIKVAASDTGPGYVHDVKYELIDNNSEMVIDGDSGIITGLERLNYRQVADRTYVVKVRAADQYCAQSSPEKCSVTTTFNLTVNKYCSLANLQSTKAASLFPDSTPYRINASGKNIYVGSSLAGCSEVGNARIDIKYTGTARSQAIVFVLDLSNSMETNVGGVSAIQQLKTALAAAGGVFEKLYDISSKLPADYSLKVGLVGYNKEVYPYDPVNITAQGELDNIKNQVNNYSTYYETNTLDALNKAEQLLQEITDPKVDKYVVLMSDGMPAVTYQRITSDACSCICGTNPPGCTTYPPIPPNCDCYSSNGICEEVTCLPASDCGTGTGGGGTGGGGGGGDGGGGSSFNNDSWLKLVFDNIFNIKPALAITTRTKCLNTGSCPSCGLNETANCSFAKIINCGIDPLTPGDDTDFSVDVNNEATAIKNLDIKFYSIYYNTSGQSDAEQRMCQWSNNNGSNCNNNTYFFSGTDIFLMFDKVLGRIVNKPKDVKIENVNIVDSQPQVVESTDASVNLDAALKCGQTGLAVTFSDSGYLDFSNLNFNYCPAKLHP